MNTMCTLMDASPPPPAVDFSKDIVIAVFAGNDNDTYVGGFYDKVTVSGVTKSDKFISVDINLERMSSLIQEDKNRRPFCMVTIPKPSKKMELKYEVSTSLLK